MNAIKEFETLKFDKNEIRNHALKFSEENYRKQITDFVNKKYNEKLRMEEN